MSFAKLFETQQFGQVLLVNGQNEDGSPDLRWHLKPSPDFGLCSIAAKYPDTDAGHAAAQEAFTNATEKDALEAGNIMLQASVAVKAPSVKH